MPSQAHKMVDGTEHFMLPNKLLIRITNFNVCWRPSRKGWRGEKCLNLNCSMTGFTYWVSWWTVANHLVLRFWCAFKCSHLPHKFSILTKLICLLYSCLQTGRVRNSVENLDKLPTHFSLEVGQLFIYLTMFYDAVGFWRRQIILGIEFINMKFDDDDVYEKIKFG